MDIRRGPRIAGMAAAAMLAAGCATTANVDYRQDYDFGALDTFALTGPGEAGSGDPRISGPLIVARVDSSIREHLAARGYRVIGQDAQARLAWRLTTRAGVESYNSGISFGYGTFSRHSAVGVGYGFPFYDVESYDEAVLTIDILDSADGGLLWRGSASRRLNDGMTPEKLTELVNRLVGEVLAQFPPGARR